MDDKAKFIVILKWKVSRILLKIDRATLITTIVYSAGNFMKYQKTLLTLALVALTITCTQASAAPLSAGWTSIGNAGTMTSADGVVTMPAGFAEYNFVSTRNGVIGNTLVGVNGSTNGSTATSSIFSANAGDQLAFNFNFVTSDGSGKYTDYAWGSLLDSSNQLVATLFTARTTPNGNTVPGFDMATISSTLNPLSTVIIAGAPEWSALGSSSGTCYDVGCGYTGWIRATYAIALTGNYHLQFGVANVIDTKFQSGLAFAGTTIAGISIGPISTIPLPGAIWIMMSGLIGVLGLNRRKSSAA
jgi:hypothetical protein